MDFVHWRQIKHAHSTLHGRVLIAYASLQYESEFEFIDLLSDKEKIRASRILNRTMVKQQVIARGILRLLLGKMLNIIPNVIEFENNSHNKPCLINPAGTGINFNLSHSDDLILFAFAKGRQIGVDVERMDQNRDFSVIAPLVFSPEEQRFLINSINPVRDFYVIWTAKEAVLKAAGHGFSFPPHKLTINTWDGCVGFMNLPAELGCGSFIKLTSFNPDKGYSAAVAVLAG